MRCSTSSRGRRRTTSPSRPCRSSSPGRRRVAHRRGEAARCTELEPHFGAEVNDRGKRRNAASGEPPRGGRGPAPRRGSPPGARGRRRGEKGEGGGGGTGEHKTTPAKPQTARRCTCTTARPLHPPEIPRGLEKGKPPSPPPLP